MAAKKKVPAKKKSVIKAAASRFRFRFRLRLRFRFRRRLRFPTPPVRPPPLTDGMVIVAAVTSAISAGSMATALAVIDELGKKAKTTSSTKKRFDLLSFLYTEYKSVQSSGGWVGGDDPTWKPSTSQEVGN